MLTVHLYECFILFKFCLFVDPSLSFAVRLLKYLAIQRTPDEDDEVAVDGNVPDEEDDSNLTELERLEKVAKDRRTRVESARGVASKQHALVDEALAELTRLQSDVEAAMAQQIRLRDTLRGLAAGSVPSTHSMLKPVLSASSAQNSSPSLASHEDGSIVMPTRACPAHAAVAMERKAPPSSASSSSLSSSTSPATARTLDPVRAPFVSSLPLRVDVCPPRGDPKVTGNTRTMVMEREMMEHMRMHRTMVSHMDNQVALFEDSEQVGMAASTGPAPPTAAAAAAGVGSPSQAGDYFTGTVDWNALDENVLENQLFEFLKE